MVFYTFQKTNSHCRIILPRVIKHRLVVGKNEKKNDFKVGVFDTLSDLIQCLNFAEKRYYSIFDSIILLDQNSKEDLIQQLRNL